MKLNLINLIFIFCILDIIETTLTIFEFSLYENQFDLVIYSNYKITENTTLKLELKKILSMEQINTMPTIQ